MIHALRRRYHLHRLTHHVIRQARRDQRAGGPAARRITDSGSPVAAALATGDNTIWSPWQIGVRSDGSPLYVHPGSVAGPGRLVRQRSPR